MAEQDGHRRKGLEENGQKGKKRKTEKGRRRNT